MGDKIAKDGAAVLISQKQYADLVPGLSLQYIKFLCSPTCEKWRCAKRIDERDLKRFSKNKVMIWYQPSNPVSGHDRPRLVDRADPIRIDADAMARMDAPMRRAVLHEIEKAADRGRLYLEDETEAG
jgi:hypothetical protein